MSETTLKLRMENEKGTNRHTETVATIKSLVRALNIHMTNRHTETVATEEFPVYRKIRHLHAATGLKMLKEAVLFVLYEESAKGKAYAESWLQPEAIREALGIPRPSEVSANTNALIFGILDHLREAGLVFHVERCGWQITMDGVEAVEK